MKTFLLNQKTLVRLFALLFFALFLVSAAAQETTPLIDGLRFENAKLVSGQKNELNSVYHFPNVAPGTDAFVTISELVNGATVKDIDDDSGPGFRQAFQPRVQKPGGLVGLSYATFAIRFVEAGTENEKKLAKLQATAIDVDGGPFLKEYAAIDMGGGLATFMGTTLDLNVRQIGKKFEAVNILGVERDNIDTLALTNMFTVTNTDISGMNISYGAVTTNPSSSGNRQYSLYLKGFEYPNQITLPLHLTGFHGMLNGSKVNLSWTTEYERNVSHFVVERSTDGSSYNQAGLVMAMNLETRSDYAFKEDISNINSNMIYYRIHWYDNDGKSSFSNVRIIKRGSEEKSMSLETYPNPVANDLRVTIPQNWQGQELMIQVYSQQGTLMAAQKISRASQTENVSFRQLPTGIYVVRVINGEESAQQRIIKN